MQQDLAIHNNFSYRDTNDMPGYELRFFYNRLKELKEAEAKAMEDAKNGKGTGSRSSKTHQTRDNLGRPKGPPPELMNNPIMREWARQGAPSGRNVSTPSMRTGPVSPDLSG